MPIDPKPGGTDILDLSGNGMGVDLDSDIDTIFSTSTGLDLLAGKVFSIGGVQVVGARQAAIPNDASGAANQAIVNLILAALRAHGLIG